MGPGRYLPDRTEGITRVEELPKPLVVSRSRNYRRRACPRCGRTCYRDNIGRRVREFLKWADIPVDSKPFIDIASTNQEVTLGGTAPNAYAKRIAEIIAWQLPGIVDVRNTIELRSHRSGIATNGKVVREKISR